jgi:hypothetical protein
MNTKDPTNAKRQSKRRREGARPNLDSVTVPRELRAAMKAAAERLGVTTSALWERAGRALLEAMSISKI